MKFKRLAIIASVLAVVATANAQNISSYFENLSFDAGVQNFPTGFDNPSADVPGWRNNTAMTDSGTEGPGAWWGTHDNFSAFMASGNGAYNLSTYTIQAGEVFSLSFFAKTWWGPGQWTVSLFYDNPANTIGSYSTPTLPAWGPWVEYSTTIAATPASQGGQLGILFTSTGPEISAVDTINISVVPEPTTVSLAALAGLGLFLKRRRC